jgi:hypothetical protein
MGRQKFLGRFDSEQEAAQELFGVYTKLNFKGVARGTVDEKVLKALQKK